jgi:hypothetical protein
MFYQATSAACAALCTTLTALSAPAPDAQLLALVPDDSFALAHCDDFAALRSRAERNDWYRLLASEHGAPLLAEFAREFQTGTDTDMLELLAVGRELRGESALFLTRQVAGFVTTPPPDRAALLNNMREWLPDAAEGAPARSLEIAGAQVEIVAWRDNDAYGWTARKGHFAALVDHPDVLGLYSGDDAEVLAQTIAISLGRYGSPDRAPLVTKFEASRAGQPRCNGIEVFVDFTPFVPEYERELAEDWTGVLPDPSGLLGLGDDLWLRVATDVFPGMRIDCNAHLNIPRDSLAASLADTFEPLPSGLLGQLPRGITQLHSLRWDLKEFYGRLRAALEEKHGADSLETLDQLAGIDDSEDGTDKLADFFGQLDGTFALYHLPGEAQDFFDFEDLGFLVSLEDGAAFRMALDRLIGGETLDSLIPTSTLEETEVYLTGDGADDFGFAILPKLLLIGFRETLARNLRAVNGVPDASQFDGSALQAAFDSNLGCCSISIQDMASLEASANGVMGGAYRLPPEEGQDVGRNPFECLLICTSLRVADGFRFELRTQ